MSDFQGSPRLVRVGDVELCVDEYGDPADPPVLLLSGAAASMDWWDVGLCEAIAAGGRRVVRYDHRDTGQSTTGEPGKPAYDGGVLDGDAIGLIKAMGLPPTHLVGVSMGGGIAQGIALARPDLVAALTLIATTAVGGVDHDALPGMEPALAERFDNPPPDPDWADRDEVVDWYLESEHAFAGTLPVDEARVRSIAGAIFDRSIDPAAAGNHWLVVSEGGAAELDVRRITVPSLVVHGTHDPMFPLPHGQALAGAIPGARLLVIQGMGHQVPPEPTWAQFVPAVLELGPSRSHGSA